MLVIVIVIQAFKNSNISTQKSNITNKNDNILYNIEKLQKSSRINIKDLPDNFKVELIDPYREEVPKNYNRKFEEDKVVALNVSSYHKDNIPKGKWSFKCDYGDYDDYILYFGHNNTIIGSTQVEINNYNENNNSCAFITFYYIPKDSEVIAVYDGWNILFYEKKKGILKELLSEPQKRFSEDQIEYIYDCQLKLINITSRNVWEYEYDKCIKDLNNIKKYNSSSIDVEFI